MYVCDTNETRLFEQFPFHPDRLLKDYYNIFHPDENNRQETIYFHPL